MQISHVLVIPSNMFIAWKRQQYYYVYRETEKASVQQKCMVTSLLKLIFGSRYVFRSKYFAIRKKKGQNILPNQQCIFIFPILNNSLVLILLVLFWFFLMRSFSYVIVSLFIPQSTFYHNNPWSNFVRCARSVCNINKNTLTFLW
jgi:hypothetical protein